MIEPSGRSDEREPAGQPAEPLYEQQDEQDPQRSGATRCVGGGHGAPLSRRRPCAPKHTRSRRGVWVVRTLVIRYRGSVQSNLEIDQRRRMGNAETLHGRLTPAVVIVAALLMLAAVVTLGVLARPAAAQSTYTTCATCHTSAKHSSNSTHAGLYSTNSCTSRHAGRVRGRQQGRHACGVRGLPWWRGCHPCEADAHDQRLRHHSGLPRRAVPVAERRLRPPPR